MNDIESLEYDLIVKMIEPDSTVLDLGSGSGELMETLTERRNARCQGVEIDEEKIMECVARGLSVFYGDLDSGLEDYEDSAFDYVILNHSLQELKSPHLALQDAFRVGKNVIVGIPNFAHFRARAMLFFLGKAPHPPRQEFPWYENPNLSVITVRDFKGYLKFNNIVIQKEIYLNERQRIYFWPELFATRALFLLKAKN